MSDPLEAFNVALHCDNGTEHPTESPVAPSDPVAMLDRLDAMLAKFVAFPSPEARWATALWVAHSHAIGAFESTPRLALLSPEKGSGKTRTLEVLALVVPEPIHAINMSAAALYRVIGDRQPTLLLDEADTYLGAVVAKNHEDLRGLINAGHRRGATVYRGEVSGRAVKVVEFPAFAACALAGIGDLPDTIMDRAIVVAMKRRAAHERVEPFRERRVRPAARKLFGDLARWGIAATPALTDAWPVMPPGIEDRPADVWEPILACADHIGGHWPDRARIAAVKLNDARQKRDPSLGAQLLADCRRVMTGRDRMTSDELVEALCKLEESPWGDMRGRAIDARGLARRLRRFDVKPDTHRFPEGVARGYLAETFWDAWTRYLPRDVADVADVTDPGTMRETADAIGLFDPDHVAPTEAEVGDDLFPMGTGVSLSSAQQPQHPQHPQHDTSDADYLRSLSEQDFR